MIFGLTLQELWGITQDIWATGNRWARWAIAVIIGWPIVLLAYALLDPTIWAASLMALIPVIALFILIMAHIDPMVLAVLSALKEGRTALKTISTMVGIELMIGVYCTLVRIGNDPELAMLLILFLVAYIFMAMGIKGSKFIGFAKYVCIIGMVVLTAIFIFGGRVQIIKQWNGNETLNTDALFMQHIEKRPGELVMNENGLWMEKQSSKPAKLVTQRFGTRIDVIAGEDGSEEMGMRTDCAEIVEVTTLRQGERIEIIPFPQTSAMYNRCSFSISETMPSQFYEVEGQYTVNDPSHAELLPCKKAPAQINTFLIKDARGELVDCHWFTNKKRILKIQNDTGEELKIYHAYNSSQAGQPGSQIGLVRGATISFRITKRKV